MDSRGLSLSNLLRRGWKAATGGRSDGRRSERNQEADRPDPLDAQAERRRYKAQVAAEKERHRIAKEERIALREEGRAARLALKETRAEAKMERRRSAELPDMREIVAEMMRRPEGLPLESYAHKVMSQHGEDGITLEVFRRVGVEHRRAVEIGCGANGGNAGVLVAGLQFEALLLDGNEELVDIARSLFQNHPVHVESAWITQDTVNELLAARGFDRDVDYLGIDLDGVDYWIWDALAVRPRVMICEYNAYFGPDEAVTVPYSPDFRRGDRDESGEFRYPKGYYGVSLAGLERLGQRKGYRLVGTVPASENAVFVRDDHNGSLPAVSASEAWRPRTKGDNAAPYGEERYARIRAEGVQPYFESRGWPLTVIS